MSIILPIFSMSRSLKQRMGATGRERKWRVAQGRIISYEFRWEQLYGRQMKKNVQRLPPNVQRRIQSNRQFQSSILSMMDRNSCFVAAEEGARAMCISKARATARRANTRRAKKVRKDISCSNC